MPLAVESISVSQPWLTVRNTTNTLGMPRLVYNSMDHEEESRRGKLYYANGHVGGGAPTVDLTVDRRLGNWALSRT